jgi:predicted AAA+ superfamily ATPase
MLYGGFPEIVEQNDVYKKQEQLQMYYMTVFYRDLVERYMIREKQALEYLMKYSLNLFSSLFSLSKFEKYLKTQGLSTTKATLSTYMTYLKEAFFVIECAKFSRSSKVQIVNPKKIYLIDSGFIKL